MGVFPAGQIDFLDLIGPALVSMAGHGRTFFDLLGRISLISSSFQVQISLKIAEVSSGFTIYTPTPWNVIDLPRFFITIQLLFGNQAWHDTFPFYTSVFFLLEIGDCWF